MDIVRAADAFTIVPQKSHSENHHSEQDKVQKTTTVVISKHTLDTYPTNQQPVVPNPNITGLSTGLSSGLTPSSSVGVSATSSHVSGVGGTVTSTVASTTNTVVSTAPISTMTATSTTTTTTTTGASPQVSYLKDILFFYKLFDVNY